MKILMGSFQVYDALNILFKSKKPHVKHLEGFILLPRKGGKLQKNFITFNRKFQLKKSKKFPHWISNASASMVGGMFVVAAMNW